LSLTISFRKETSRRRLLKTLQGYQPPEKEIKIPVFATTVDTEKTCENKVKKIAYLYCSLVLRRAVCLLHYEKVAYYRRRSITQNL